MKPETKKADNRPTLEKNLELFRDEYGDPCFSASFVASLTIVLVSFVGLVLLACLIWFSMCFAHFLKTGGWSWIG